MLLVCKTPNKNAYNIKIKGMKVLTGQDVSDSHQLVKEVLVAFPLVVVADNLAPLSGTTVRAARNDRKRFCGPTAHIGGDSAGLALALTSGHGSATARLLAGEGTSRRTGSRRGGMRGGRSTRRGG